MKTLIAEDAFASRLMMQQILKGFGPIDLAEDGKQAVEAVRRALESGEHYDLICLDVMMPEMDGHEALTEIRALEDSAPETSRKRATIVMTTALAGTAHVEKAVRARCDHYLVKPIRKERLLDELRRLKLIE